MIKDIPSLVSALNKISDIMAEDINTPICRPLLIADAGIVIERLRMAMEAALDQTIVETSDDISDFKTRLETIHRIIRQAMDLSN